MLSMAFWTVFIASAFDPLSYINFSVLAIAVFVAVAIAIYALHDVLNHRVVFFFFFDFAPPTLLPCRFYNQNLHVTEYTTYRCNCMRMWIIATERLCVPMPISTECVQMYVCVRVQLYESHQCTCFKAKKANICYLIPFISISE